LNNPKIFTVMAQPYVGEIRMFAGNFAPAGWMFCEGQLLPISEYETLFNLIGTTYGGDGQSTFALPDLRGRLPVHQGNGFILAETGGSEEITLTVSQIPAHTHPVLATSDLATAANPGGSYLSSTNTGQKIYSTSPPTVQMPSNLVGSIGGSQPHTNFQPYLCVDFIISLYGIFPSPT
jgi:microcystin-dependent protein